MLLGSWLEAWVLVASASILPVIASAFGATSIVVGLHGLLLLLVLLLHVRWQVLRPRATVLRRRTLLCVDDRGAFVPIAPRAIPPTTRHGWLLIGHCLRLR